MKNKRIINPSHGCSENYTGPIQLWLVSKFIPIRNSKKCDSNFGNLTWNFSKKWSFFGKKFWTDQTSVGCFQSLYPQIMKNSNFELEFCFFFLHVAQKFNYSFSLLFGKKLLQGTKFETNHMWSNYTEGLPPKLIILSPGGSSAQERNKTGNNFQFSHNSEFSQGPQCRKPDAEPTRDIEHPVGNLVDRTSVRRNLTR